MLVSVVQQSESVIPIHFFSPRYSAQLLFFLLLNFLFCIGVKLINNVFIVSGGQQRDSVIRIICYCS